MEKRAYQERSLNELLVANHQKVMEGLASGGKELQEIDRMQLAYLAGRLDGVIDTMWIKERSA